MADNPTTLDPIEGLKQIYGDDIFAEIAALEDDAMTGDDLIAVTRLISQRLDDIEDAEDIAAAREAMAEGGFVPWDEVKTELGL